MGFQKWLEARTYADQVKYVYHWNTESDWYKVLHKQGASGVRAVWVSPNKDANESWTGWIVSGQNFDAGCDTFYLHKIAMPRSLFSAYWNLESARGETAPREFVVGEQHWPQLQPVSAKKYSRADLLKLAFSHARRLEAQKRLPHGSTSEPDTRWSKNSREYQQQKAQEKEWDQM